MSDCRKCKHLSCRGGGSRRRFLTAAGAAAVAVQFDVFEFASSLVGAEPKPREKPLICVAFALRKEGGKWWPAGTTAQLEQIRAQYEKILTDAAKKLNVRLDIIPEPLKDDAAYLEHVKQASPNGQILMALDLKEWGPVLRLAQHRGDIPTIIYANVSNFTRALDGVPRGPGVYLGSTHDVNWLKYAMRMLYTLWHSKRMRILDCPGEGYVEAFNKVTESDELRAVADLYMKTAKNIVEPTQQQILQAVKHYLVLRRLIREGGYDGCTVRGELCTGADGPTANPACLALSKLMDEGFVAACEGDAAAAMCQFLTLSLFDMPGLMGNPSADTVKNWMIVSHCTSALKLEGIHEDHRAPFVLRDFHNTGGGVCPMVAWPIGKRVTVMDFHESVFTLGAGRVAANTDDFAQPPSGGCRTTVAFALDDVRDVLRTGNGHHQWCVLADVVRPLRAYCQLAGLKVADLTGQPIALSPAMEEEDWCDKTILVDEPGSRTLSESQRRGTWLHGMQGTMKSAGHLG